MAIVLSTSPYSVFYDDNGNPLSGGKVYTYLAGTLTPRVTYTDQGGLTPNANPVILDSAGRADIWYDNSSAYKIIVKTSADVAVRTVDNIQPFNTASGLSVLGTIAANTIVGNSTGATAAPTALTSLLAGSVIGIQNGINDFRLTLTSATPVTTADVTGATTIYCTPYRGKKIALYDGSTGWNVRTSAEFSLALGTLTSGKPYDVFCYDNAGTPTLEFLAWTSDTTRATALTYQDGVLSKTGALTRRYMGTFYTTSTTTTEDSLTNRYLWNYYNRCNRPMIRKESTASWVYNTATWRQANASTSNQLNFIVGVSEDAVHAEVTAVLSMATNGQVVMVAVGVDSTSTPSGLYPATFCDPGQHTQVHAKYTALLAAGKHFLAWLENSSANVTGTWYGNGTPASSPAAVQSGIQGTVFG